MNTSRLKNLIEKQGYALGYRCSVSKETLLVRPCSDLPELFERVVINKSKSPVSNRWNAFAASVELSVVPGYSAVKGICETQFVSDLPFSGTRGTSILVEDDMANIWEKALLERLPQEQAKLLKEKGQALFRATDDLRRACRSYYAMFERLGRLEDSLDKIKGQLDHHQIEAVERLPRYPVVTIPNQVISFQIAIGLICLYGKTVESQGEPLRLLDPYEDRRLFLRLQVLASRIAGEIGWNWSGAPEEAVPGS